jgi:hypothetical protein
MRLMDSIIQEYKRDVDRTLLRANLKLSAEERVLELIALLEAAEEFQRAGRARDLQAGADLEALMEEREKQK